MTARSPHEETAYRIVRALMTRQGVEYDDLVQQLAAIGIEEKRSSLISKVSRGKFPFSLVLQIAEALDGQEALAALLTGPLRPER